MRTSRAVVCALVLLASSLPGRSQSVSGADVLLTRARQQEDRYELRRAEALYHQARGLAAPGSEEALAALLGLGRAAEAMNDHCLAERRFRLAAEEFPERPEPWNGLAWLEVKLDRRLDARMLLDECFRRDPDYPPALAALASVEIEEEHYEIASDLLARAEKASPSEEVVLAIRAEWLYRTGDMNGAVRYLRRLRAINPWHLGAMQRLASGFVETTQPPYRPPQVPAEYDREVRAAVEDYRALRFADAERRCAVLDTSDAGDGRPAFYRGLSALRQGDIRRAIEFLERAVAREGDSQQFLNALCVACRRLLQSQWIEYGGRDGIDRLTPIADRLPAPDVPGAWRIVRGLDRLMPREKAAVGRTLALFADRLPALQAAGVTHDLLDFDEGLCDAPARRYLLSRRSVDGRAYGGLRGVGGLRAATGIEMVLDAADLRFDTFAHEFAHQLMEYGLTVEEREVLRHLYRGAKRHGRALDFYAETNESEYFAQGVEAFASIAKSPWRHVVRRHTRAELAVRDAPLYRFLLRLTGTSDPDPVIAPLSAAILEFYQWAGDDTATLEARILFSRPPATPR